jgi:Uma2 family endonuclease
MTAFSTVKMTSEQFMEMGENPLGIRMELAHGEIVMSPSPTPGHSSVIVALIEILGPYIRRNKLGTLLADTDTRLDEFNTRRPDLIFVSAKRSKMIGEKALMGVPDLCVEVISPGSERIDREEKFGLFESRGVKHYWIFDPVRRTAEAYALKKGRYVLAASGGGKRVVAFPPFGELEIDLGMVWPGK